MSSEDAMNDGQASAQAPTLEQIQQASARVRELGERLEQAHQHRRQAVREARLQGARKKDLLEPARLSARSVGYLIAGVTPAPQLGQAPDLEPVREAVRDLEAVEQEQARLREVRDELIRRARAAKLYRVRPLMEASGLSRAMISKI